MDNAKIQQRIDIQKLYEQDLFNRHYLFKNVNHELKRGYTTKLILLCLLLSVKMLISRLVRVKKISADSIFISWGPLHDKRAKDLTSKFQLVTYDRSSFAKDQIALFSKTSLRQFVKTLSRLKKSNLDELDHRPEYVSDSFFYRYLFLIDFMVLKELVKGSKQVYIAGYNDRNATIISKLCKVYDKHLSMLQHGVLGKKEQWKHLTANRFFYLYPFSKDYVRHQIEIKQSTELIYLPKQESSLQLTHFEDGLYEQSIAYATSPADSEKDIEILKILKEEVLDKQFNLLIYPHPFEKKEYYNRFIKQDCVFISRERHKNIKYLISRYSTLGIDYSEKGISPVFLNFENHDTDFFKADTFHVFTDLNGFRKWFRSNA